MVKDNKGAYPQHSTIGELSATLGVDVSTLKRWLKSGYLDPPDVVEDKSGYRLWSPEQVRRIIQKRTNRGDTSG